MKLIQKMKFRLSRSSVKLVGVMLLNVFFSSAIHAKTITGTIKDKTTGEVLIGASVVVRGTEKGTVSDFNGKYSIAVDENEKELVFSYIGMVSQTIIIGKSSVIDVLLVEDRKTLDEVVVVGYGTQRKKDLTGAVSQINANALGDNRLSTTEGLISGKIAGVSVISAGGEPGGGTRINIRGKGTMLSGSEPLYVIDGIPSGFGGSTDGGFAGIAQVNKSPIDNLNPNDIESITVLKDASSAAIYGASAANGVILITTKKGKAGKGLVEYNGQIKFGSPVGKYKVLNSKQFIEQQDVLGADKSSNGTADVDWQDEILRNTVSHSHDISLSGGSNETTYRASVRYNNDQGAIINTDAKSYAARFSLSQKALNDKATFGLLMNMGNSEYHVANTQEIIGTALAMNPTIPVKDENGNYIKQFVGVDPYNPVEQLLETKDVYRRTNFGGTASLKLDILKNLILNANLTLDKSGSERNYYVPRNVAPLGTKVNGQAGKRFAESINQKYDITITYLGKINENNSFDLMLGNAYDRSDYSGTTTEGSNFQFDQTLYNNLGSAQTAIKPSSYAGNDKLSSLFGRINYNAYDRYLLQASFRRDGSSKLRPGNETVFPSFSVGWRVSEESFVKEKINWMSNLKLRIGYGQSGNQNIPGGHNIESYYVSPMSYPMGGNTFSNGVRAANSANLDLKWEITTTLNLGLDFAFLKDRIDGSFELYSRETNDMLFFVPTVAPSTTSSMVSNVGAMRNKGFELSTNFRIIEKNELKFSVSANIAYNKNKVTELQGGLKETFYGPFQAPGYSLDNTQIFTVGEDFSAFYGYKYAGLDANNKELFYAKSTITGNDTITTTPTAKDKGVIGKAMPNWTYGFSLNLNYKRFDMMAAFRGEGNRDVFNVTKMVAGSPNRIFSGSNGLASIADNKHTKLEYSKISDRWVEEAGFLRLDFVSVGYNINTKGNKYISKARIYGVANNLFVLTNYSGPDPEVFAKNPSFALGADKIPSQGLDFNIYPRSISFSLGCQLSF